MSAATRILADWWSELTKQGKQEYLQEHPDSKYAGRGGSSDEPSKPKPSKDPKSKAPKKEKAPKPKKPAEEDGDDVVLDTDQQVDMRRYKVEKSGPPTPLTPEGRKIRVHIKKLQDHIDKLEPQYHAEKDLAKKKALGLELDRAGDEAHDLMVENWSLINPGQTLKKRGIMDRLGQGAKAEFKTMGDAAKQWFTSGGADAGSSSRKAGAAKAKALKPKIKDKIKGGASWPSLKGILKGLKSGSVKSTKSVGKAVGTALALSLLGAGAPVAIGAIAYLVGRDFLKFAKKKVGASVEDPGPALDTPRVDALDNQEADADLDALLDQLIDAIADAELDDEQLDELVGILSQMEPEAPEEKAPVTAMVDESEFDPPAPPTEVAYPKVTFRDINFWMTYAEDSLDKAHLNDSASWRTCNKGTVLEYAGHIWAQWDRATNSGWAYNLSKPKPVGTAEIDALVQELQQEQCRLSEMRLLKKRAASEVHQERIANLRSQIYTKIAKTSQPDLQKLAVRYQYLFAPQGAPETNPEVQRYHRGLGTYWEPYAAPFGFDTGK